MEMKHDNSDSTEALDRFARDRRKRTTVSERVERRPGPRREADDASYGHAPRRASYNPNFTEDNRPVGGRTLRPADGAAYGGRPAFRPSGRPYSHDGRDDSQEHPTPSYSRRPYSASRYGGSERAEGRFDGRPGRPEHRFSERGDRSGRPEGRSAGYGGRDGGFGTNDDRPARPYGKKKTYGGAGYAGKPACGRKPSGRFAAKRPYGGDAAESEFRRDERPCAPKRFSGAKSANGRRCEGDRPKSYPRYDPNAQTGEMRLNRFIAQSGLCSRREADDYIQAGLVSVNGTVVTELGTKVQPTDEVRFNDSRVEGEKKVYLVLNKPKGYVTSLEDPHADKTVMDLVKGACTERIYPVGRLDKNSLGLLLFTNDGDLTRQLTHPSYLKQKVYQLSLDKPLTRADMDPIAEGITLEDGEIHADEIACVKEDKSEIGIEIHSGRNRIVRRIFESLGYSVRKLDRVYYAGLTKKNLKRGAWRFLPKEEVMRLKSGQYE